MKRIFKRAILILYILSFGFFVSLHTYVMAQEKPEFVDEEDIQWLDEEDIDSEQVVEALQPENDETDAEQAEALQPTSDETDEDLAGPEQPIEKEKTKNSIADDSSFDSPDPATEETAQEDFPEESADAGESFADQYEQDLYQTYIQYYSKRVSMEEWNNIVGNKDVYIIQSKDTLWDISKVLFGDSSYWPKLWSSNPSINNPHLIQPQGNLGFIYGTEGAPPSLNIVQGIGKGPTKTTPSVLPDFLKGVKVNVPSSGTSQPIIQNIPASLSPLQTSASRDDQKRDLEISFNKMDQPTVSFLRYYMAERPVSGDGTISGKKEYGAWFHAGQRVLLEIRDPVNPGHKMAVIQNKGKLYSSIRGVRGPFGYQVAVQGEVEIIGRLPDSFDIYEAKVTKSFNPVTTGAIVVNKNLIQFDYTATDINGSAEAQIIGFPSLSAHEKHVASPYSLVYLNRGASNGLSVGQMYQVKANPSVRSHVEYGYEIKVGELKIIYTESRFATGIITRMSNPVHVGDYIASLHQGLATERGYDPLGDDISVEEEGVSVEEEDDFDLEPESAPSDTPTQPGSEQFEDADEDDIFEAF